MRRLRKYSSGGGVFNGYFGRNISEYYKAYYPGIAMLNSCTITANSATKYGGGIMNQGTLTLTGSTLSGNLAGNDGGGLADLSSAFLHGPVSAAAATLTNSTVYGNTAAFGGGITNEDVSLIMINDTVAGNRTTTSQSSSFAGALDSISRLGDILLTNTLIAGNYGGASPSIAPSDISAAIDPESNSNLIGDGDNLTGIVNRAQGNQIGSATAGTTINADLGPLANNGGPTETVAIFPGSPAIDAGDTALAVDPTTKQSLTTDQRGPGFRRVLGPAVDIGAFEVGNPPVFTNLPSNPSIDEGSTYTFTAVATDPNPALTLTYTLGPGAPAGASINAETGVFSYTPPSGPATATFTLIVTDNGSPALSTSQSFTLTVNNVDPSVSVGSDTALTQGQSLSRSGQFTDPGDGAWVATVNYGDGSGTNPLTLSGKTFQLSHTYATAGTDIVTVTVLDSNGGIGSKTSMFRSTQHRRRRAGNLLGQSADDHLWHTVVVRAARCERERAGKLYLFPGSRNFAEGGQGHTLRHLHARRHD